MSSGSSSPRTSLPAASATSLKVSAYDRFASWLISFLILAATLVGLMFLIWLAPRLRFQPKTFNVTLEEEGYGRGDRPAGFGRDTKAPGDPNIPMLDEPAGEELPGLNEPEFAASMVTVGDVVTAVAEVGDVAVSATGGTQYVGFGGTGGGEGGLGDNRPPGPLGDNPNVVPRWERWEIKYVSANIDAYAQQLDYFKIELGAIGRKAQVDYAFNLAKRKPDTRVGPSEAEKRLYLSWKTGVLKEYDRQLLERAGIEVRNRIIVQFYSPELEKTLATLEMQNAQGRSNREFLRTVFGVKDEGGKLTFYVANQIFRPGPRF